MIQELSYRKKTPSADMLKIEPVAPCNTKKPLIKTTKQYNGQVQIGPNRWLTIPPQTKDKYKMLRIIDSMLRLGLEISII